MSGCESSRTSRVSVDKGVHRICMNHDDLMERKLSLRAGKRYACRSFSGSERNVSIKRGCCQGMNKLCDDFKQDGVLEMGEIPYLKFTLPNKIINDVEELQK